MKKDYLYENKILLKTKDKMNLTKKWEYSHTDGTFARENADKKYKNFRNKKEGLASSKKNGDYKKIYLIYI